MGNEIKITNTNTHIYKVTCKSTKDKQYLNAEKLYNTNERNFKKIYIDTYHVQELEDSI